ncbi:hypothetical protein [Falsiroseomonas ponticola]|uniref:hypothetical protein n=1 Tax=Falsiroseomonas ponticola TaxID=2786951 RepID=UPI00193385AB|nr:hypothetical protein [Roseomonas ponticola]
MDGALASGPVDPGLLERLAVLEERSKPKPKSVVDRVKEWAGVATALIALLYTIPLGVWDTWVTSPEARGREALRSALIQVADLESRQAQGFAQINDHQARIIFLGAVGAQRAALLARVEPLIDGHRDSLTVPELMLLGYNLAQAGRTERAIGIFEATARAATAQGSPLPMRAEVDRQLAMLHSNLVDGPNIAAVRMHYARNLAALLVSTGPLVQQQAAVSALEWAFVEKFAPQGNWACGTILQAWALRVLTVLAPAVPQAASLLEMAEERFSQLIRPATLPPVCPDGVIPPAMVRA